MLCSLTPEPSAHSLAHSLLCVRQVDAAGSAPSYVPFDVKNKTSLNCLYATAFTHTCRGEEALPVYTIINRCNQSESTTIPISTEEGTIMRTLTYHDSDIGDWTSLDNLPSDYAHPWV